MRAGGDEKDVNGVEFKFPNPYEQEHYALVEAIRNNLPYNEGHFGATSSFTAVLGRMATYSGKISSGTKPWRKASRWHPELKSILGSPPRRPCPMLMALIPVESRACRIPTTHSRCFEPSSARRGRVCGAGAWSRPCSPLGFRGTLDRGHRPP